MDRWRTYASAQLCADATTRSKFTREINYVQTVKANIITNVLGFLTGHSRAVNRNTSSASHAL